MKLDQVAMRSLLQGTAKFALVFAIIFVMAKFGQYFFYGWNISPAILWPPTGIGVAVMWLYGYRYAVPIFLGLLAATLTGPNAVFPAALTTPVGQVAGQLVGVWLLNRLGFEGVFANIKNVLIFFISIISLALVAPLLTTTVSYLTSTIDGSFFTVFSRRWAGYAFSSLILTPFIIAWAVSEKHWKSNTLIETVSAGALLTISTYLLFWTRLSQQLGFLFFGLFFISVIWLCLRFPSRIVTLSVVYITVVGLAGLFLSPAPERALNAQVFAAELFLFIVVPIMYAYSALVKERHKNLEELKQAFARIEQENANKTNFIAVLAHELRNPLAPIKTTLEIVKLQKLPSEIEQLVDSAYSQVHVMRRLLDDLLDITRVTQGRFEIKTETVQLLPVLQNVIEATKHIVSENGHTLILETTPSDTTLINVDPIRFEQVLVNIINNAAKYTEASGVIKISYEVKDNVLELRIEDNGKGIEPENLERIFDSFWQIREANHSAGGIGVGLALAKQIVELHHGSIWAESKGLGKGSTFAVSIPCVTAASVVTDGRREEVVLIESYTLLVVDDNIPAAHALSKLLSIKGHTVHTAHTGSEALQLMGSHTPDIVLLDIGLPDMSGYDVAKRFREQQFAGALIALSGYGQQEDKRNALEAGFDVHFTKPMAMSTLERYLETWKGRRR
ncbi:MAG TPA: ATP-binding protein [Candidatus Paceibacterota bacterium]